jgi:hypothetical protein
MMGFSEQYAVVGTIDPQSITNSEVFSDVIDMSKYTKVAGIFLTGNMDGSNGAFTARCVTCDSAGNNVGAFKTATAVGTSVSDNQQVVIEVSNNDLAGGTITTADRYIKFGIVSGSSGGPVAAVVLGEAKNGPASDGDLATVAEIEIDKD